MDYPGIDPCGGPTTEKESDGSLWTSHEHDDMDSFFRSASPAIPLSPFPANARDDYHDSILVVSSPLLPFSIPSSPLSTASFGSHLYGSDHDLLLTPLWEWEASPHSRMPPNLLCDNNGCPAVSSLVGAVPVVEQGTSADELSSSQPMNELTEVRICDVGEDNRPLRVNDLMVVDELPHPQNQFPLQTNDLEVQPCGGREDNEPLLVEEQIQEVTPNFSSPTPAVIPGLDKASYATSEPKAVQGSARIAGSAIALPQDQGGMLISRTQGRAKERPPRATKIQGRCRPLSSQVVAGKCNRLEGIELLNYIRNMFKHGKHVFAVWRHFWWTDPCEYCYTVTGICKHCKIILRDPETSELLIHLKNHDNIDPLASTKVSKQTQRSSCSRALQIREIAENPMPLTENMECQCELIETDKSNCVTAMVDTQGTNSGALLLPRSQHQVPIDLDDLVSGCSGASRVQWNPCCKRAERSIPLKLSEYVSLDDDDDQQLWVDFDIRLPEGSCGIRLQTRRKNREQLSIYEETFYGVFKFVEVTTQSPSWMPMPVSANPYKDPAGIVTATASTTDSCKRLSGVIGGAGLGCGCGCGGPGKRADNFFLYQNSYSLFDDESLRRVLSLAWSIGERVLIDKAKLELEILTRRCYATPRPFPLRIEDDSARARGNRDGAINDAEPGDVPPGTNKRRLGARQPSPVWSHFTKVMVVDAQGRSVVGQAKCNHCGRVYQAHSKTDGTSRLGRHIEKKHPEHAESLKRKKDTA